MTPPLDLRAEREGFLFGGYMVYAYLALGGMLGTLARFSIGGWVHTWAGAAFPWGTLAINLLGSFLLGLAMRGAELSSLSPEIRGMITVGFCGAFTTFSTFTFETISLMQAGARVRASLYAFGSLGMGIVAVALGLSVANLLLRTGG
jgi:CrcB protein